jgi:hypothetical protein
MKIQRTKEYEFEDIFSDSFEDFETFVKGMREYFYQSSEREPIQVRGYMEWDSTFIEIRWESEETEQEKKVRIKREESLKRAREARAAKKEREELAELMRLKKKYEDV